MQILFIVVLHVVLVLRYIKWDTYKGKKYTKLKTAKIQ